VGGGTLNVHLFHMSYSTDSHSRSFTVMFYHTCLVHVYVGARADAFICILCNACTYVMYVYEYCIVCIYIYIMYVI
jgi:hypothetical protein